jgi:hypothetical protein
VESVSGVGENIVDGINNVYEDYTKSKSNKREYGLIDGVRSFTRPSALKKLTKDYSELPPRVKLKESTLEEEE